MTGLNVNSCQHNSRPSAGSINIGVTDRRYSVSTSKKNEIALAKVSLAIVLIFILCHSVRWIPNVYELARIVRGREEDWPPWIESLTHISHFLTTLNSSVNFYIYCFKHFSKSSWNSIYRCNFIYTTSSCKRHSISSLVVCLNLYLV